MTTLIDTEIASALSGAGLLGLVTTGMYHDPALHVPGVHTEMRLTPLRDVGFLETPGWILRSMSLNDESGFETTAPACPLRMCLSDCCPLDVATRDWE